MEACCDLQGFWHDGYIVIKEFALASLNGEIIEHYLFTAPFPFRKLNVQDIVTNSWLTSNYHHLEWYGGYVDYQKFHSIMERIGRKYKRLYVKGDQKQAALWQILPRSCRIVDLGAEGCPTLFELSRSPAPRCSMNHPNCALANTLRLRRWVNEMYSDSSRV